MSQIEGSAVHDIRDLVAATLKTNTDIPSVVVPDGFKVQSLETLQASPSRIRQVTNLISPGSLIAYIQRFRDERSVVFADKTKTRIVAVLDFHHDSHYASWGDHKAIYDCPYSDDWKAWSGSDGNKMNQIDFAEFLENNIQNVAPVGDNYSGSPYQVDARIRYRLRDGQLVLWYELIEPKKVIEHAFQEIVTDMENQLGEDLPIYEGSI